MSEALPGVLSEIAEIVGRDAALDIAVAFGGSVLHVPGPERAHRHEMSAHVGQENARLIAERFTGEQVYVPKARKAVAARWRLQGMTSREIAGLMGVSTRTAQRLAS